MSDLVSKFWDIYEKDGIEDAVVFAQNETDGTLETLKSEVADLITEAQVRDVDVISFLEQLEAVEAHDAVRTDNDAPVVSVNSSDDDDGAEDEAEPAEESTPDRPADAGTEES